MFPVLWTSVLLLIVLPPVLACTVVTAFCRRMRLGWTDSLLLGPQLMLSLPAPRLFARVHAGARMDRLRHAVRTELGTSTRS